MRAGRGRGLCREYRSWHQSCDATAKLAEINKQVTAAINTEAQVRVALAQLTALTAVDGWQHARRKQQ